MTSTRCSQCQLPMTSAESQAGVCPVCATTVAGQDSAPASAAVPSPAKRGSGFLRSGLLGLCLLSGGVGGFLLHPAIAGGDDPVPDAKQHDATATGTAKSSTATAPDAGKSLESAQELETLAAKLSEDLEAEEAKSAATQKQLEAARRQLKALQAESSKSNAGRVKELTALTDKLNQDIEAQKKELLQAKAREAGLAAKPQADRVLVEANKKLQKAIEAQAKVIKDSQKREEVARQQTEKVRQTGERTLDLERQKHQRAMEQLRQESQRSVEQVRQQLRQQELVTQKVRQDLEQQKRLTEEAKRKNK